MILVLLRLRYTSLTYSKCQTVTSRRNYPPYTQRAQPFLSATPFVTTWPLSSTSPRQGGKGEETFDGIICAGSHHPRARRRGRGKQRRLRPADSRSHCRGGEGKEPGVSQEQIIPRSKVSAYRSPDLAARNSDPPLSAHRCFSSRRHTTNTRFLNNVVRGVQTHNRAVLCSSSVEAEQKPINALEPNRRSRNGDRDEKKGSRMRGWSDDEGDRRASGLRLDTPSGSSDRRFHRHHASDREEQDSHRRRDNSAREKARDEVRHRRRRSQSPRRHKSRREEHTTTSTTEAGPSKMDRYFDEKYDPMLDIRAESRTDGNGLVEDDGWERLLQAVKDKEARKRARKEGRGHRHTEDKGTTVAADVMQTQYTSRGEIREWDKGKGETLD